MGRKVGKTFAGPQSLPCVDDGNEINLTRIRFQFKVLPCNAEFGRSQDTLKFRQNMDVRWSWFDINESFFETKAPWLKEPRNLHGSSVRFFELAGKLVWLSRDDYELSSLAFFQAVIGLERALRLHFRKGSDSDATLAAPGESLASLLERATSERVVTDAAFSEIRPFSDGIRRQAEGPAGTHCRLLSVLVPKLRNQFMHGTYLLAPDYLHLAIQMREMADVLVTKRPW